MGLWDKDDLAFAGIVVVVIAVFFYFILGISGMVSALAIILIFFVPSYFILDNFNLKKDEKLVFSFFIGAGIFPSIAYWLGLFISLKLAILITFLVLVGIGIGIGKVKKKSFI